METLKNTVILNGFRESREYVNSLSNIIFTGQTRSNCGYYLIDCYETI